MVALRTLVFTLLVPGSVAVYVPGWLLHSRGELELHGLGPLEAIALVPIGTGIAIYLWCAWDFTFAGRGTPWPVDPPRELVVRGLYRYTRNPMYVGLTTLLLGEALLFRSLALLAYALAILAAFHLFVTLYEERTLRRRFGEAYSRYCASVPRWLSRR